MEQQPGLPPVALHGTLGDLAERGDLGEREAAEEVEVHDLRQRGLQRAKLAERVAESRELLGRAGGFAGGRLFAIERDLELAAALRGAPPAGVVDDQASHRARRVCEEPRAVSERDAVAPSDVEVRLVEERRGAEGDRATIA